MRDNVRLRRVTIASVSAFLATIDVAWILAWTVLSGNAQIGGLRGVLEAGALATACTLLAAFAMGLYDARYLSPDKLMPRALLTLALTAIPLSLATIAPVAYLPRSFHDACILSLAIVLGLVVVRMLWPVAARSFLTRQVAVLGSLQDVSTVRRVQSMSPRSAFRTMGPHEVAAPDAARADHRFGAAADEVVVGDHGLDDRGLVERRLAGSSVIGLRDFIERECRTVDVLATEPGQAALWPRRSLASRAGKRLVDLVVSLALGVLTLPVLLLAALAVRLCDRGPIFYRQTRIGLGGRPFEIVKFRTMRVDAEADGVPRWAERGDARVTAVGGILRRSRIDELPQLLSILRGDMSLVGPRPERAEFVRQIAEQAPSYECRHFVLPGLTGWAQINYPHGSTIEQNIRKTGYDLYYVKNGSIALDVKIILQTIRVVLFAEGGQ